MTDRKSEIDEIFRSLDVNGDGRIQWSEFSALMADRWLGQDGRVDLEHAAALFDDKAGARTASGPPAPMRVQRNSREGAPSPSGGAPAASSASADDGAGTTTGAAAPPPPAAPREGHTISMAKMRQMLCHSGDQPLSADEFRRLQALADPQNTGYMSYQSFLNLPCWEPPDLLALVGDQVSVRGGSSTRAQQAQRAHASHRLHLPFRPPPPPPNAASPSPRSPSLVCSPCPPCADPLTTTTAPNARRARLAPLKGMRRPPSSARSSRRRRIGLSRWSPTGRTPPRPSRSRSHLCGSLRRPRPSTAREGGRRAPPWLPLRRGPAGGLRVRGGTRTQAAAASSDAACGRRGGRGARRW